MNRFFEAQAFLAVVNEGSFTSAAGRLGVSRSYASKLVSRLEDRLGVRLLHRSTRQLALTESGRNYFSSCQDAMHTLVTAETAAIHVHGAPRGLLRLAVPAAFGAAYLTEPLARFKALYPDLVIDVVFADRSVDLLAESFDLAVRVGDLGDSSLIAVRLTTAERQICASPGYLERRGEPMEPEELIPHACLAYTDLPTPDTWRVRGPRGELRVEVHSALAANSGDMLIRAAEHGLGIAFMPAFHSAASLRAGRLRRILAAWSWQVPIQIVFPAAPLLPTKVRACVDFLRDWFRRPTWLDDPPATVCRY